MDILCPEQRFWLCILIIVLAAIFCIAHIWRSIKLKRTITRITIKMYVAYMAVSILAVVGLTGAIKSDAFTALLGAVIGYILGEKAWAPQRRRQS